MLYSRPSNTAPGKSGARGSASTVPKKRCSKRRGDCPYLAWLHTRKAEAAGQGRASALIELATEAATDYLSHYGLD